jgi:hypothetical protein
MKPKITRFELKELSVLMQKEVCPHNPRCARAYTITTPNDGFMICEGDIKDTTYDLMKMLGMVDENYTLPKFDAGWTIKQEKILENYLKENGKKYGSYAIIGKLVGKTRQQVKDKVYRMKRDGRI